MIDLEAYFSRIGYTGSREPNLETLQALQSLHPAKIPFEAIDVLLGRGISLSQEALEEKLVRRKRGGYCFEQNNLFKSVLTSLGFQVEGLIARVVWMVPQENLPRPRTHMVLRVTLDGEPWLVDVGFGSVVPTVPLRWKLGEMQETPHENYHLVQTDGMVVLEAELPDAWKPVYQISLEPQFDVDYEMANWFTSTYPASRFRTNLMVASTTPQYRAALFENRFTMRPGKGEMHRESLSADQLEQVLFDIFGLAMEPEWRPVLERAVEAGEAMQS